MIPGLWYDAARSLARKAKADFVWHSRSAGTRLLMPLGNWAVDLGTADQVASDFGEGLAEVFGKHEIVGKPPCWTSAGRPGWHGSELGARCRCDRELLLIDWWHGDAPRRVNSGIVACPTHGVVAKPAADVQALVQARRELDAALQCQPASGDLWRVYVIEVRGAPAPAEKGRRAADDRSAGVSAAAVFAALSEHLPEDAIVSVDAGNHAYSLGRYLESKGQPVLMSGYLRSIGFGYPAAMGAWAAEPGRPVVAVTGDGGFAQYAMELNTAVKYAIPIKHLLLNNHALGKIEKEQIAGDFPVWHTSLSNPDWAAYAELCGATGIRVTTRGQLDAALRKMFESPGPVLARVEQDAALL